MRTASHPGISAFARRPVAAAMFVGLLGGFGQGSHLAAQEGAGAIIIQPIPTFIRGDANLDGRVDVADASAIGFSFAPGAPPFTCPDAADVDDNGVVVGLSPLGAGPPLAQDMLVLLDALRSTSDAVAAPPLPAPFPEFGTDPTRFDGLGCEAGSTTPSGPDEDFGFHWTHPAVLVPGQTRVSFDCRVRTGSAIQGFSQVFLINTDVVTVSSLAPRVPSSSDGRLPVFAWAQQPSQVPGFDLVLVAGVFIDAFGVPLDNALTQGPVGNSRVARLRLNVKPDAPTGEFVRVLRAFEGAYAGSWGAVGGIVPQFVVGGGGQSLPPPPDQNELPMPILIVPDIPEIFLRGDSNVDGTVDIADPIFTLRGLFFGTEPAISLMDAADADDSGDVDLTDSVFTLDFLFRGIGNMPAPYPQCGPDPTANDSALPLFYDCTVLQP